MRIYSLFDRKLKEYGGLVVMKNDESVKRAVQEGIAPNSSVGRYPEDYDLMHLGEFDPESGAIVPGRAPRMVDNVRDVLVTKGEGTQSSSTGDE